MTRKSASPCESTGPIACLNAGRVDVAERHKLEHDRNHFHADDGEQERADASQVRNARIKVGEQVERAVLRAAGGSRPSDRTRPPAGCRHPP